MLRAIYKAVKAIIAFCSAVAHFIVNIVTSLVDFVMMIPKAVANLVQVIGVFPFAVLTLLTLITFILVLKSILGRGR